MSDVERVRNEVLKEAGINPNSPPPAQIEPTAGAVSPFAAVVPGTPPPPPPDTKAVRAPMSESYTAQNPSTQRKVVEGDPYREQLK